MNKEWFIFKGTHHLGPYSLAEMEDFYRTGEINMQSLVWREGSEKWEALSKTAELKYLLNAAPKPQLSKLPDLPSLPEMPEDLPPPALPKFLDTSEPDADEPPPIPLDALLNPKGHKREVYQPANSYISQKNQRILFGVFAAVFIAVLTWFFMNEKSSSIQLRVKGVMPVYLDKLQEVAAQKTPSLSMTMALSLDGKTLFASTNKDGEMLAIVKMQSLPNRILGTDDVSLMVRGVIKDHLGEFSRMQLTKGAQFVPGEYSIDFTGRQLHFLNKKFKFLNSFSFFKKLNTNYNYETTALIYAGTPREFEKKLLEYKDSIVNEKLKPYTDKLERLQTFQSLLNKTVEDYLLVLDGMKKAKEISQFESKFTKEISPILQSLVVAAHEMAKKDLDMDQPANKIATYETQVQLGKQLGEMASAMITETGSLKKVTAKEKTELKNKFEVRYKNIKMQIDSNIKKLEEKIQSISQ